MEIYTFPDTGYQCAELPKGTYPVMEGWKTQYSVGNDLTMWVDNAPWHDAPWCGSEYYRFIKL